MGYMGFGMRKEDWSRKPKEVFKKVKDRYGDQQKRAPKATPPPSEAVTTDFDALSRLREQHERRFHLGSRIAGLIFGMGILTLLALLYMALITP